MPGHKIGGGRTAQAQGPARRKPDGSRAGAGARNYLLGTTILSAAALFAAWPAAQAVAADDGSDRAREPRAGDRLAQADRRVRFDIPALPLTRALTLFGEQSGLQVTFDAAIAEGRRSRAISGTYTPAEAIQLLLAGTDLTYRFGPANTVTLARRQSDDGVVRLDPLTVEGAAGRFGDAPPEPGGFKAEFQTSATKTPLPLRETPQAITVITPESIEARQARDLATAIELSAGVADGGSRIPGPFGGEAENFAAGTGFVLRGQEVSGGRGIRSDGFAVGNVNDMAAYERVEVVKGPSGFYGQGSLGGFINLVRKKPKAEFGASGTAQIGSFDTYRGVGDVTGPLNESGSLRGRLTGAYEDSGAFVDGVETERVMIAPSLEARIAERTRVLAQFLYQKEDFRPNPGIPVFLNGDRLVAPNVPRSKFIGVPNENDAKSKTLDARLRVDHELTDKWLASLLLHTSNAKRKIDQENYAYYLYAGGGTTLDHSRSHHDEDWWAGELRLDGKVDFFGQEHRLLFGVERNQRSRRELFGYVYLGYANIYAGNFNIANTNAIPFNFTDFNTKIDNSAVYGQTVLSLTERTRLLAGLRYERARQENVDYLAGTASEARNDAHTVRVGLAQDLTDNVSVYATYAQSFNPVTNQARSGQVLDPETGDGYEAGIKSEWFDKKLSATLAVYRQELENIPITDPTNGPGENFFISAGLHRTDGIEMEVTGSPFPGLTVGISAALTDNEFIDSRDPNVGLKIDGSVDWQYSLYGHYEIQDGLFRGLGFGATLVSLGDRNFIRNNRQIYADGYERVDLSVSYKGLENIDMNLLVRNVLDETYLEQTGSNPNSGHFFGSPRAFIFRATARF